MSDLRVEPLHYTDSNRAVVFLHAADGDGAGAWTHTSGFSLPAAIDHEPGVDAFTVRYAAGANWTRELPLATRAAALIEYIETDQLLRDKQLLFVGHSFAGLIAKDIVRRAARRPALMARIAGVAFLATPHASDALPAMRYYLAAELGSATVLRGVKRTTEKIEALNEWFQQYHHRERAPMCLTLYDTRPFQAGFRRQIRPVADGDPRLYDSEAIAVDVDHGSIARPLHAESIQCVALRRFVQQAFAVRADCQRFSRRAAAVCFRLNGLEPEFLLVRSKSDRTWTVPKGKIERDEQTWEAAAREAWEEAGVHGVIDPVSLTRYVQKGSSSNLSQYVTAYLLLVTAGDGSGEDRRRPQWFTASEARARLREGREPFYAQEFVRLIDAAIAAIPARAQFA